MEFDLFGRSIYIRKEVIIVISIIAVLALGVIGYVIKSGGGEVIVSKEVTTKEQVEQESSTVGNNDDNNAGAKDETAGNVEKIKVYVVGCVKQAGVVTLEKGQIIDDAIKAAGGATKEADLENINLAYELNENTMLKILSKRETQSIEAKSQKDTVGQEDKTSDKATRGVKIIKDSGGAVISNTVTEAKSAEEKGKININSAEASELDNLPGVGEKTAADIIEYREKNGGFKKIEEIMNVPRIGESRFKQMKELITVQ